jgi:hypothetical protein
LPEPRLDCSLAELGAVSLVAVSGKEEALSRLWNGLFAAHHPLGNGPLCGAQQRYLIKSERFGWLGGLAFSASARHLRDRDEWIGWGPVARQANRHLLVNNSRFLILPEVRVAHLASHVLGMAARRVKADWPKRYGYTPALLETFVEEQRYAGTCYVAAGWRRVGEAA